MIPLASLEGIAKHRHNVTRPAFPAAGRRFLLPALWEHPVDIYQHVYPALRCDGILKGGNRDAKGVPPHNPVLDWETSEIECLCMPWMSPWTSQPAPPSRSRARGAAQKVHLFFDP
jgi:hypothetical protein